MGKTLRILILTATILLAGTTSEARQEGASAQVTGRFLADSLKVGEPVPYSLTVTYPAEQMLLLPDSAFDYGDFHYLRKKYFPTRQQDSLLVDSVVYYVTTFELDTVQKLALPAIRVAGEDSLMLPSEGDDIFLKRIVTAFPDTLALRESVELAEVPDRTNWPLIYLVAGLAFVLIAVVSLALARPLRRWYLLRKLNRDHARFRSHFDEQAGLAQGTPNDPEGALATWKRYLEQLENKPYAKMTTREISRERPEQDLSQALRDIDRHIYGRQAYNGEHTESYRVLVRIVEESYDKKLKEVKK
ncbi:hypothetical protein AB9P05_13425 [Roseivirga sp. BDSF3-8]|uniref:hypothetical protein n=1 Tax=Roseivirga sp. BDSF3-8 TaxID=3241598 RepID=UPI003532383F